MSCRELEEQIWLYDELSTAQKKTVDDHLMTCADCKMIWDEAQALRGASRTWQQETPQVVHAAQLTHKIMNAIEGNRDRRTSLFRWIDSINTNWLRYSMATVSLLILTTFLYDRAHDERPTKSVRNEIPLEVSLTSSDFIKDRLRVQKSDDHTFSLLACIENKNCPSLIIAKKKYYESH